MQMLKERLIAMYGLSLSPFNNKIIIIQDFQEVIVDKTKGLISFCLIENKHVF